MDEMTLQRTLLALGHDPHGVNGDNASGTQNAVKSFQKANNLPPTGTVDKLTKEKMDKALEKPKLDIAAMTKTTVVEQATLKCTLGSATSKLKIVRANAQKMNEKKIATVADHVEMVNIFPFGTCNRPSPEPSPCTPIVPLEWMLGDSTYTTAINKNLTAKSKCICFFGGCISLEDDGQNKIMQSFKASNLDIFCAILQRGRMLSAMTQAEKKKVMDILKASKSTFTLKNSTEFIDLEIRNYTKANFSKYLTDDKMNRPLSDTIEFVSKKELMEKYGKEKNILGFNDGKKSYVDAESGYALATAVHENFHQLSCNDTATQTKRGVKIDGKNTQVNEGITEYYTQKLLGDHYPDKVYSAYDGNKERIRQIESVLGEDKLAEAYFQNKPEIISKDIDTTLGEGKFDELSGYFETNVNGKTKDEKREAGQKADEIVQEYVIAKMGGQ